MHKVCNVKRFGSLFVKLCVYVEIPKIKSSLYSFKKCVNTCMVRWGKAFYGVTNGNDINLESDNIHVRDCNLLLTLDGGIYLQLFKKLLFTFLLSS